MRCKAPKTMLLALALLGAPAAVFASIAVDEEEVVFSLEASGASKVYLVGDFNGWNPTMDGMSSREGPWEIRLYLVPGRYRYQFIVDGERISDPDNPNRDPDGTTYFIFTETDAGYAIVFEPPREGAAAFDEVYRPTGRGAAIADSAGGLFAGAVGVEGEVGGGVSGSLLVGLEYESGASEIAGGRACLLRAAGRWSSERGFVEAFHRAGDLDLGDPLSLFGTVGPFRYPLGIFARGAGGELAGPFGITGKVFYANRIEGYRSGIELSEYFHVFTCSGEVKNAGLREDADMFGLSVRGGGGPLAAGYLFRHDRGPGSVLWYDCDDRAIANGYRSYEAHGGTLTLGPLEGASATLQYIGGRTALTSLRPDTEDEGYAELARDDWEEGYRAFAGVLLERGGVTAGFDWNRTTVSGDPELREGRPKGRQDILEARIEATIGPVRGSARLRRESFGNEENTGRVFWLARRNFWLDGDALTSGMLPFLDVPVLWEAGLRVEQDQPDTMPGPYRIPGYIAGLIRLEPSSEGPAVYELTAGQGFVLHRLLSLHVDLRYIAYQRCGFSGSDGFLDAWFGLRASLTSRGWAALGFGVAPHRFDRWLFDFTGDGREAYLLDAGVFRHVDSYFEEDLLIPRLEEAEQDLADDFSIRFEAGLAF